jgi:3-oxoacyl-[acyl-carrier-protein] synthase II
VNTPLTITGTGLITVLGYGPNLWQRLRAGDSAEGRISDDILAEHAASHSAVDTHLDRAVRLALYAAREALASHWTADRISSPHTGLFVGTSKGPISSWLSAAARLRAGQGIEHLAAVVTGGVGHIAAELQKLLAMHGPAHTSVAACASGLFAMHRAAQAIALGECDRALVVASDASIHPLFDACFANLGVLSKLDPDGRRRCVPFDPQGRGFFLSEGAAAVLLERSPTSTATAMLDATWIGADGTHLLAIDPKTESLRYGLHKLAAGNPITFIHAHATGTAHDQHELEAIRATLGNQPGIYSSKGCLGHTLGAAGLMSLVISARSHQFGQTPDDKTVLDGARSITIAQGFGGHIALAALRSNQ